MCDNEPLEGCTEVMINQRKLSVQYNLEGLPYKTNSYKTLSKLENWPNFELPSAAGELDRISRRLRLGLDLKSKSDSSICVFCNEGQNNSTRCRDVELSSFPSDSDITIFRVRKKTRLRRIIASDTWEVVLGDGSHLAESPSMVNLATLVQGGETHCHSKRERVLVPLSSWDQVESLSTAKSEIVVSNSRVIHEEQRPSLISNATANRLQSKDAGQRDRITPQMVVAIVEKDADENEGKSYENSGLLGPSSVTNTTCVQLLPSSEDAIPELDAQVESLRQSSSETEDRVHVKVSTRVQKALRRVICSCFAIRSDKNKEQENI